MADKVVDMYERRKNSDPQPCESRIERVDTVESYVGPERHEKLYLSPENRVKGELRRTFGNPTPV